MSGGSIQIGGAQGFADSTRPGQYSKNPPSLRWNHCSHSHRISPLRDQICEMMENFARLDYDDRPR